jgi:O-methyltransferase domain
MTAGSEFAIYAVLAVVGGSFFDSVPEGADAYLMKAILHDWKDDVALKILGNIRAAIAPGGKLLLLESVLPERSSSDIALLIDLEMLDAVGGKERIHAEWANLLSRAVPAEPCRPHSHAGIDHRGSTRLINAANHAMPEPLSAL